MQSNGGEKKCMFFCSRLTVELIYHSDRELIVPVGLAVDTAI